MTNGVSNRRRRTAVSLSMSAASADPIDQLDRVVETFHQVNRALSSTVLGRTELIALGGLLTQISSALLALTDQLAAPTQHFDRNLPHRTYIATTGSSRPAVAGGSLQECRNGIRAAYTAARAFHADLRQRS